MVLNMNSVGIPGGFGTTPGFRENLGFGVVLGDLGPQKAFAQIARNNEESGLREHMCVIYVARVCARSCHANVASPRFRSPLSRTARKRGLFAEGLLP